MLNEGKDFNFDIYQEYFNAGYIISKHLPEVAEVIENLKSDDYKLSAMKDGIGERQLELEHSPDREKERMPSWLKNDPFIGKEVENEPEFEKEKDVDIEPEI